MATTNANCETTLACPNCDRKWSSVNAPRNPDGIAYCPECSQGPAYYAAPGWLLADRYALPILKAGPQATMTDREQLRARYLTAVEQCRQLESALWAVLNYCDETVDADFLRESVEHAAAETSNNDMSSADAFAGDHC